MAFRSIASIFFCALFATIASAGGWNNEPIWVKAGESIQTAINTASPGQLIFVEAGTYAEQLTITTDGLRLVGKGAVLVPPKSFKQNTCSGLAGPGTEAGICVTGHNIVLADFVVEHRKVLSVGQPIKDILISGFQVQNFTGLNIAVVGGFDCQVVGNTLHDGSQYGVLTVGSTNTHIDANSVASTGDILFIAVCMDDSSGVKITNNYVHGYAVGLCVQTRGAYLANNYVTGTCWGVFIDPGITGVQVLNNHVGPPDPICFTFPDGGGYGVALTGASSNIIQGNTIQGQKAPASALAGDIAAGIGVFDDPATNTPSSNNMIIGNTLVNNDIDILIYTNGTGNVAKGNQCKTPAALCG